MLLALLSAAAQAQAAPAPPVLPMFETFRRICLEDDGRLAAGAAQPAQLRDIPDRGRRALGMLDPLHFNQPVRRFQTAMRGGRAIAPGLVPNRIYRLAGPHRAWLLTPAAGADPATLGPQCILIWEGRDYAAAAIAKNRWLRQDRGYFPPAIAPENLGWADASFGSGWMVAGSLGDWTFLSALPSTPPMPKPAAR